MPELDAGAGVLIRTPDDVEVRVVRDGPLERGVRRGAPSQAPATDALKMALSSADFTIAAEVELIPTPAAAGRRNRAPEASPEIEVRVGRSESALVLIEGAGGVYAWAYPEQERSPPPGRRGPAIRTLVFSLGAAADAGGRSAARGARPGRRGIILDWISEKLIDPVRAYVLKFVVKGVIDLGVDYVEGDKPEGLVSLAGDDPVEWRPGGAALPVLATDRPARILLLVHGTFSSIAGGFGHLVAHEAGRTFLAEARKAYDAVVGFDHKTLAADPTTNAAVLMDALRGFGVPEGSTVDAVVHSRGGLVYRVFAEKTLADHRPDIKLGKAVFVGCTNGGTHLAEPQNWAAMVDLYTNVTLAATRAVGLLGGAAVSPLISEGIKTLGRFVQMLAEVAIGEGRAPGLAAMQPTSGLITELNGADGGLDRLATYYAVTSNFVARREPRNGVTKELAEFLIDRVTNRLFQIDNDLVVDTGSMTSFGTRYERLAAGETFAFGSSDSVHHMVYFASEEVPVRLAAWLGFGTLAEQLRQGASNQNLESATMSEPSDRGGSSRAEWNSSAPMTVPTAAPSREKAPPSAAEAVPCHFAAEMEPHPQLKQPVPVFVTVSRETIGVADHAAAATTPKPVDVAATENIAIELIARRNCRVIGSGVAEAAVPDRLKPETLRFLVEGTDEGAADILVEARQGTRTLVSFVLAPIFVKPDSKPLRVSGAASAGAAQAEEPAVLRIYEILDNGRLTLRFDLASYNPNISVSESRTLPAGFSRDAYVADIFGRIENAWAATSRMYDQFLLRLQSDGMVMANELLPDKVREALWRHRDAIRAIQVISEEPFIPWELLYVTDPKAGPEGKGFLGEWGLVRWLHNTRWPGRRLALGKDRVRYVVPNYLDPGLELVGAVAEREMLAKLFASPRAIEAESLAVARFLQTEGETCDLLHFACHGQVAQRAVMRADLLMTGTKTETGFALDSLSADVVKTHARFAADGGSPIVFINACQTGRVGTGLAGVAGFVDAFLRPYSERGAGALVGALWSVDDALAFTFAETFYGALLEGKTLVDAAKAAREAAKNRRELTWLAYTVYGNPFARVA